MYKYENEQIELTYNGLVSWYDRQDIQKKYNKPAVKSLKKIMERDQIKKTKVGDFSAAIKKEITALFFTGVKVALKEILKNYNRPVCEYNSKYNKKLVNTAAKMIGQYHTKQIKLLKLN